MQTLISSRAARRFVLLQIDGLSHAVLSDVLRQGTMPSVARALEQYDYCLEPYSCGLPAETNGALSALLYGVRIPGCEWWDKERRCSVTAPSIERELQKQADGFGLTSGGAAFFAPLAGGAEQTYFTLSRIREARRQKGALPTRCRQTVAALRLLRRSSQRLVPALLRSIRDTLQNLVWLWQHRQLNTLWDRRYACMLALTQHVFPAVATQGILEAIRDQLPVAFADLTDYDESAHYFGWRSERALRGLRTLDSYLGEILRSTREADYELVVYSDHGQTPSTPFRRAFGSSLEDLVQSLCPGAICKHVYSMANLYVPWGSEWVTDAELQARVPGMLSKLAQHPGIGLVVSRTSDGLLLRGPGGTLRAQGTSVTRDGNCPLRDYGDPELLLCQIQDYAQVAHTGDVLVFARYCPERDHTYDFGETYTLRAAHGGLGGQQGRPFVLSRRGLGLRGNECRSTLELRERLLQRLQGSSRST